MAWQKIDDQFGISKKVIRIPRKRRQRCVGLWLLAGNYSSRILSDGVIEAHELDELDAVGADVDELIRVELWHGHGHECDRCQPVADGAIIIHDYLIYNPSRAKVLSDRETERVRKVSQRDKSRKAGGQIEVSGVPVPIPSRPVPLTDVTDDYESSHLPDNSTMGLERASVTTINRARSAGVSDLTAVTVQLSKTVGAIVSPLGAVVLVEAITSKAKGQVRDVDAYVARVCQRSKGEVRQAYDDLDIDAYTGVAS